MDSSYHYPPELLDLLVDTIPRLGRSKKAVLLFFRGAGVPVSMLSDLDAKVQRDPDSINWYEIARIVLRRLNEGSDAMLRQRREVVRRVTEWDDFSTCYPDKQLEAEGLVAKVRTIVSKKDSFTRMRQERDKERQVHIAQREAEAERLRKRSDEREGIKQQFYALFGNDDPHKRGTLLESSLNDLFRHYGILVRDSFRRIGNAGEGVVEQIDGVIRLDGDIYLAEMKWMQRAVGRADVINHIGRLHLREASRGLLITATTFSAGAKTLIQESLSKLVLVTCTLEEIVLLLETEEDLADFFRRKVDKAIVDQDPF